MSHLATEPPSTGAIGPPASATAVGDPQKAAAKPAAGSSGAESARALAALVVANLGCGLSGIERHASSNCSASGGPPLAGVAPALVGAASARSQLPDPAAAAPADGDHGGSAAGTRIPGSPGPSPAPGGAAGGSAAGGSGVAFAACLSLAALLRLAPSRAMRRLRLSCEPWLTACFALIPERPG
jgi:hypothetical protein